MRDDLLDILAYVKPIIANSDGNNNSLLRAVDSWIYFLSNAHVLILSDEGR